MLGRAVQSDSPAPEPDNHVTTLTPGFLWGCTGVRLSAQEMFVENRAVEEAKSILLDQELSDGREATWPESRALSCPMEMKEGPSIWRREPM